VLVADRHSLLTTAAAANGLFIGLKPSCFDPL
jgi:hypothetical protein